MKNVLRLLTIVLCLLAGVASAQGTVKIGVVGERATCSSGSRLAPKRAIASPSGRVTGCDSCG